MCVRGSAQPSLHPRPPNRLLFGRRRISPAIARVTEIVEPAEWQRHQIARGVPIACSHRHDEFHEHVALRRHISRRSGRCCEAPSNHIDCE